MSKFTTTRNPRESNGRKKRGQRSPTEWVVRVLSTEDN